MADTSPKILQAPTSPLWYHVTISAVLGLALAFGYAFFVASKDSLKAETVAAVCRAARVPLLQHRAEKGAWPEDFDFSKAPESIQGYGFAAAVQPSVAKCTAVGTWRFTTNGPAGKGKPALVFTAAEPGAGTLRLLTAVDAQLDDGRTTSGKFRADDQAGVFTLRDE